MAPSRLVEEETYDFIICGWSQNFDSETDWNIVTEPMKGVAGRQVKCSRGRMLGGSSGVNGTLCIRGPKQDYDDWELEGWSGEEMYKYMAKAETFHPKDWFKANPKVHGTNGPLHVSPHDLAPISNLFKESLIDKGFPLHDDMFATGEVPHGCGHVTRTVNNGLRTTGADFISGVNQRDNITIENETTVDRIVFERDADGRPRASGVQVIKKNGEKRTIRAAKEIVISGGAYCSPAILMRSGIGPKEELERVGIETLVDSPGVGKNLQDHVLCFIFYEANQPNLTNDHLVYHSPTGVADSYTMWKDQRTGVFSTFPFGIFAYGRIDDRLQDSPLWTSAATSNPHRDPMGNLPNQPQIEIWNTELYGGPKQYADFPVQSKHVFAACPLTLRTLSRGTVGLKSKDPMDIPIVDHKYLDNELDLLVLAEACRFVNEIVLGGSGTKSVVKGSWPPELTHHTYTTREDWIPYVKKHATTCYHASGTCKMGKADDEMAVLDEKLRVRGVNGLRVADVSVMPLVNNGHTQMPAYGIGEKAADLLKEAYP